MIYQYISSVLSMLWLFVYTILHCSIIDFFLQIWKNLYYTKIIIHSENNEEAWFLIGKFLLQPQELLPDM